MSFPVLLVGGPEDGAVRILEAAPKPGALLWHSGNPYRVEPLRETETETGHLASIAIYDLGLAGSARPFSEALDAERVTASELFVAAAVGGALGASAALGVGFVYAVGLALGWLVAAAGGFVNLGYWSIVAGIAGTTVAVAVRPSIARKGSK